MDRSLRVFPGGDLVAQGLADLVESRNPRGAHAAYNALIGRIVSFAQAYARAA